MDSKGSMQKIVILILIFIFGSLFGLSFMYFFPNNHKEAKIEEKQIMDIAFLSLPDMLVNLKTTSGKGNILKATFILEISNLQEKEKIEHLKPLIVDRFHTYLRELELSDLQGSEGIERVRQELFSRANAICSPIQVKNVLIKEFIIQ